MLVGFRVYATLTDKVHWEFRNWIRKSQGPFHKLSAIGGPKVWILSGVLRMRPLKQKKRMAREITGFLVDKIEALTNVGVEKIEFDEIDPQVIVEAKPWEMKKED